ncbi:MAG TPA: hypothetical protein VGB41_04365 [Acidimicrobiia bacterium]
MRSTAARFALLMGIAVAVPLLLGAPRAMAAVEGGCTVTLNGVELERIDSLGSPIELSASDTLVFSGTGPTPTEMAKVELIIGPVPVDSGSTTYRPASTDFSATIDLDEVSPYGVGLFRVRGITDGCVAEAWLRISGRSPFATLSGLTAAGLTLGGLTGLLGAVASRRRWSRFAAAGAGLFTGIGGAVLGQEFGRLQLSYPSLTLSAAGAAGVGFLLGGLMGPRVAPRAVEPSGLEAVIEPAVMGPRPVRVGAPRGVAEPEPMYPRREAIQSEAPAPLAGPYWCYVLAEVDVFDLTDHTKVVVRLRPGSWYLCKREVGGWAHVSTGEGPEGWAPKGSVHRQG